MNPEKYERYAYILLWFCAITGTILVSIYG